ncbi:undecaprenyl/decaprenyl-phosphate alpha-N-acetylglucosaminyl 1-phosphate transferase, partial [Escherichia coli]|nr:undecaprenyl/decaprenyl-phosphate alpha-N-acetylglucosaminyl 1-phosphate transferase [Escherichia coli]
MSWMIILICFGASVLLTPLIRKIALYFDITDKPDQRRINIKPIPSLGGLAMFISFT